MLLGGTGSVLVFIASTAASLNTRRGGASNKAG
jgi:hypothetical protein